MGNIYLVRDLQEFDRRIESSGKYTLEQLMREAGRAVADWAMQTIPPSTRVVVLAGTGNNGGDAMVAAQILDRRGYEVQLVMPMGRDRLHALPARVFAALPEHLRNGALAAMPPLPSCTLSRPPALVIDGLLGTGFRPGLPLPPELSECILAVMALRRRHGCRILSIDVPSGMHGDCADDVAVAMAADWTVTLVAPTPSLLSEAGVPYAGKTVVAPLPGMELLEAVAPHGRCFDCDDAAQALPMIARDAHKFRRGSVAAIGCSSQYGSAVLLTATAALRCGAGMVSAIVPDDAPADLRMVPNAVIVHRKSFGADGIPALLEALDRAGVVAIGPGLGRAPSLLPMLEAVIDYCLIQGRPLVIDADALNLLSMKPQMLTCRKNGGVVVLTPHAGEMQRLMAAYGIAPGRAGDCAQMLADQTGGIVVCKGARMIVASPARPNVRCVINAGCPALATAGSGDVLAGCIAAMLSQCAGGSTPPHEAVALAGWLHATAGEQLSAPGGQFGLIADDLPSAIARLLRELA